jgi:hypothetical protein
VPTHPLKDFGAAPRHFPAAAVYNSADCRGSAVTTPDAVHAADERLQTILKLGVASQVLEVERFIAKLEASCGSDGREISLVPSTHPSARSFVAL